MPGPSNDDLLRFIDANVESIEQLEILRILGETPETPRSAADLARASQTQPSAIAGHLAALEQRGLIKAEAAESELMCRLAPQTPELEQRLGELLRFYREHPVSLIQMVYARDDRLKAFADAFRLRKET
ncbi:MAG: MarR family transcriptional regulator [Planctomycetia bacterium]|nr:MarR family transcriptional regulator [Planctomycetia bacterium]